MGRERRYEGEDRRIACKRAHPARDKNLLDPSFPSLYAVTILLVCAGAWLDNTRVVVTKSLSQGFARPLWPWPGLRGRLNRIAKSWHVHSNGVGAGACGRRDMPPCERIVRRPHSKALSFVARVYKTRPPNCDELSKCAVPTPPRQTAAVEP